MARIRSVHPGLFTDEVFMGLSPHARIVIIGLWTEADDNGVFEWKPLTLKARLLPVDAVDMQELLSELEASNAIKRFEYSGRVYGAIRNFRKYQKPQKPTAQHPLPECMVSYVGLSGSATIPLREDYNSATISSLPMEDGEGEGRGEEPEKEKIKIYKKQKENPSSPPQVYLNPDRCRDDREPFEAWRKHYRKIGKKWPNYAESTGWNFPSRWPPGHLNSTANDPPKTHIIPGNFTQKQAAE